MLTIRCLSFFVSGEWFATDVTLVRQVARKLAVTPVMTAPPEVVGITNINGKIITVLSLAALLGKNQSAARTRGLRTLNAVVFKAEADDEQLGLEIDRPGELIEIDGKKLVSPPAAEQAIISGVAESEGKLYRIVSASALTGRFYEREGEVRP